MASDPFVGRDDAIRRLHDVMELAAHGERAVALVAGEAGIGKTRLVREVTRRTAHRVRWAACWEGDGAPAYWPWEQLLRDLVGDAAVPSPVAATVRAWLGGRRTATRSDAPEERFVLFDAVTDLLGAVSRDEPLVLVVDDLQWADAASIRLLELVVRDQRTRRVAIVATYRDRDVTADHPLHPVIGDLVRDGLHLRLDGLSEDDVVALARDLAGAELTLPSSRVLHRRSGGNPFYIRELVRLLGDDDGDAPRGAPVPATVRSVVTRRLAALGPRTIEVLRAAAVLGAEFHVPVLATMTDCTRAELTAALDDAIRAGILVEHSGVDEYAFVHALVREVLDDGLDVATRAHLHERAVAALQRRFGDARVTEIAHHAVRAGSAGAALDAGAWASRAGDHCHAGFAYEDAVSWYTRALALLEPDDEREGALLLRRGDAAVAAGDSATCRDSFAHAALVARRRGDVELLAHAALGHGSGAGGFEVPLHDDVQIAVLEEALDALGPAPSTLRVAVLSRLSVALTARGVEDRRRSLSEQAITTARAVGEPSALGYALAAHCDVIAGPDWCETRLEEAREVIGLAAHLGDWHLELLGRRLALVALLELGDIEAADVEIARFARLAAPRRHALHRWYVPLWHGMRALMRGDLDTAARACEEAQALGAAARSDNALALTMTQWWVRMRYEGRFAEAGAAIGEVVDAERQRGAVDPAELVRIEAVGAAEIGDRARASRLLRHWMATRWQERPRDSEWLPETVQLAELAATLDDTADVAATLMEQLEPYAGRYCVEGIGAAVTGSVAWYLAMLARALGRTDDASRYEAAAREAHQTIGFAGEPPPLVPPGAPALTQAATVVPRAPDPRAALVHEGATWAATFAGTTRRVRDSKGVRDLSVLLRQPEREVHCLELAGGTDIGGGGGPALDGQARRAYEQRIRDLHEEIEDARHAHDLARAERAEVELDQLVQQISQAFGLSGRTRGTGSAAERARSAVTARIRAAIRHMEGEHPDLARHLHHSVQTGAWCAYRPETPVAWEIDAPRLTS